MRPGCRAICGDCENTRREIFGRGQRPSRCKQIARERATYRRDDGRSSLGGPLRPQCGNLFGITEELASAIAHRLHARITHFEKAEIARRPTNNLEAYDLYLKANSISREAIFSNQIGQNLLQASTCWMKRLRVIRKFFEAYCDLAMINDELYFIGIDHTAQRLAIADKAVAAIVNLRPDAAGDALGFGDRTRIGDISITTVRSQRTNARRKRPAE